MIHMDAFAYRVAFSLNWFCTNNDHDWLTHLIPTGSEIHIICWQGTLEGNFVLYVLLGYSAMLSGSTLYNAEL
jgi:hypothetical protein